MSLLLQSLVKHADNSSPGIRNEFPRPLASGARIRSCILRLTVKMSSSDATVILIGSLSKTLVKPA